MAQVCKILAGFSRIKTASLKKEAPPEAVAGLPVAGRSQTSNARLMNAHGKNFAV
jgi:hypothetical protein